MAFKAGSIYADTKIDQTGWKSGLAGLKKAVVGAGIGVLVTKMFKESIKAADEFQKTMSNVRTIVDETQVSTQDLAKQLFNLDPALGDTTELTKGLYQAFSSGATTSAEAMQTTIDAAKFAKATLTDTFTAVDVLTTAVNAYGKETESTTHASNIFFTAIKDGKLTGEQLAGSIGQSIPLFASSKIGLDQLAAGMAALTKQGVDANNATTQLNAIVSAFLKPSEAMKASLDGLGYSSGSAFLEAEGLTGALQMLEQQTGGDAAAMAELLPNIRAMRGAMALTGVGGEEFTNILADMQDVTGRTDEAFGKQEKTFDTLKNQMGRLAIVSGNIGKVFVDQLAVGATKAAGGMISFLTSSRGMEVISTLAGHVAGAFEIVKTVLGPLIDTIGPSMKTLFAGISETMDNVTGSTTQGAGATKVLAIVGKSLGAAFAVVSTVIGSAVKNIINLANVVYRTGSLFSDFLTGILHPSKAKDLKKSAGEVVDAIKGLANGAVDGISDIISTVQGEFANFGEETDELAQEIQVSYTTAFENTKNGIAANWAEIFTGQQDFTGDMVAENEKLMAGLLGGVKDYTEGMDDGTKAAYDIWSNNFDALIDKGDTSYTELKASLKKALDDNIIKEKEYAQRSTELWASSWSAKIDIIQTFGSAIISAVSTITSAISSINEAALNKELSQIEKAKTADLEALQERFNSGLLTEDEYQEEKQRIEDEAKAKENAAQKKSFENQKALSIVQAGIDAASSIMGWWAQAPKLGPIAGPIFAGTMTGLTLGALGAQIAAISSQEFTPKRTGGPAKGLIRMNEDGGELAILPDGSTVIPHDLSAAAMSPSYQIYNNFDGAVISNQMDLEAVANAVTNKMARKLKVR